MISTSPICFHKLDPISCLIIIMTTNYLHKTKETIYMYHQEDHKLSIIMIQSSATHNCSLGDSLHEIPYYVFLTQISIYIFSLGIFSRGKSHVLHIAVPIQLLIGQFQSNEDINQVSCKVLNTHYENYRMIRGSQ